MHFDNFLRDACEIREISHDASENSSILSPLCEHEIPQCIVLLRKNFLDRKRENCSKHEEEQSSAEYCWNTFKIKVLEIELR